jgi:hypothetical protein
MVIAKQADEMIRKNWRRTLLDLNIGFYSFQDVWLDPLGG